MNTMIQNPILRGFNPDASAIRVGDDYYIATSTFEWFPGVIIHHSKDLVHWRILTRPLNQASQLDLRGVPSSGGIWAPSLSYDQGLFYLCYTIVYGRKGVYKDLHNYVITAPSIEGPWSEPVYLNASGFDHFLFHDTDGRKYLFNMQWDSRKGMNRFGGIIMQEYDHSEQKLVGTIKKITSGTELGVTEGPMVYKKNGYYYLLLAEGGTGINHAATLMRSTVVEGPYEVDPDYPIMTTRGYPDHPLQKAGHGSLLETADGEWYMVHICSRSLSDGSGLSPLGRETSIQHMEWTEAGWLRIAGGDKLPQLSVPAPNIQPHPFPIDAARDHFDQAELSVHWFSLRVPANESWLSLQERPGYLRLRGRESLYSLHRQSLVCRRIQSLQCEVETCVEFEPSHYNQMAGLVLYYDEDDHYYLRIGYDEVLGKHLAIIKSDRGQYDELDQQVSIHDWKQVYLKAVINEDKVQFLYSKDGKEWNKIGPELYSGLLADEYKQKLSFTGAFAGLCAQDLNGTLQHADFDYFEYRER